MWGGFPLFFLTMCCFSSCHFYACSMSVDVVELLCVLLFQCYDVLLWCFLSCDFAVLDPPGMFPTGLETCTTCITERCSLK